MTRNTEAEAFFVTRSAHSDLVSEFTAALATGAAETEVGPEWVEVRLFRSDWPNPDLRPWALRAYAHARGR